MTDTFETLNAMWAELVIGELVRQGIRYAVLSPGSRSTPLVLAAAHNPGLQVKVHYDERGAAYHALGYARATGDPAIVITTSGTAVANLFPAVVEAAMDHLPMILLTADRPPELHGVGANQTIDQQKIFGKYVRAFFNLPCPESNTPAELALTTAGQAHARCLAPEPGPAQVNCMFREPLAPLTTETITDQFAQAVENWRQTNQPMNSVASASPEVDDTDIDRLKAEMSSRERGVLVVGGLHSEIERKAVLALASALGWPLLADITSGLRLRPSEQLIPYYDLITASSELARALAPETVVHIGGKLTSKRFQQFLKNVAPSVYAHISPYAEPVDPDHIVTHHVSADIAALCDSLAGTVAKQSVSDYLDRWRQVNALVEGIIVTQLDGSCFTEPEIVRALSQNLPDSHALFVASSMPIRWLDMYATTDSGVPWVGANRGASGIDGTIATATGCACGLQRPVTCLVGDLALLHDLNSLGLVAASEWPVIILLLNNNGGHIFDLLPVADIGDGYEQHFVAPHGLRFADTAAQFRLAYACPTAAHDVIEAYRQAVQQNRSCLIEVSLDARESYTQHRRILEAVSSLALSAHSVS